mmetsp:Transcript_55479/g.179929  ORF Transcript_55479/g.179929 Transcript_55479/m.179929 type:complete len:246 (-) Transcript_55479:720-1457(-)
MVRPSIRSTGSPGSKRRGSSIVKIAFNNGLQRVPANSTRCQTERSSVKLGDDRVGTQDLIVGLAFQAATLQHVVDVVAMTPHVAGQETDIIAIEVGLARQVAGARRFPVGGWLLAQGEEQLLARHRLRKAELVGYAIQPNTALGDTLEPRRVRDVAPCDVALLAWTPILLVATNFDWLAVVLRFVQTARLVHLLNRGVDPLRAQPVPLGAGHKVCGVSLLGTLVARPLVWHEVNLPVQDVLDDNV